MVLAKYGSLIETVKSRKKSPPACCEKQQADGLI
jgi:hypothetical protein